MSVATKSEAIQPVPAWAMVILLMHNNVADRKSVVQNFFMGQYFMVIQKKNKKLNRLIIPPRIASGEKH